MKKFKIYQLQRRNIIHIPRGYKYDVKLVCIGTSESTDDLDTIWNLCNASEWNFPWAKKVKYEYLGIKFWPTKNWTGTCGSDIIIKTGPREFLKADSFGWTKTRTLREAMFLVLYEHPGFDRKENIMNKPELPWKEFEKWADKKQN